jgi:hypothetical protein
VREHVGQAHDGGLAVDVLAVVALDHARDGLRQAPAASEYAADQGVVDAELAALVVQALLRRARGPVDLARVARIGVHEHELADVVQQGGDEQPVAVLVAGGRGEAVGGALDGHGVQAEALGSGVPGLAALEELERLGVRGEPLDGLGREHLDGADDRLDLPAARGVEPVGQPHHGDDERHVGLDGPHDIAGGGALLGDQRQQAVARLGQRREDLQRLEGRGEPLAVALVAGPADDGVRRVAAGAGAYGRRCGCGAHGRVIGRGERIWSLARGHGRRALTSYRHPRTDG